MLLEASRPAFRGHAAPHAPSVCDPSWSLPRPALLPPPRSGGMIFTFYKAQGLSVGSSLVEEDKLDLAKELMAKAKVGGWLGGCWWCVCVCVVLVLAVVVGC